MNKFKIIVEILKNTKNWPTFILQILEFEKSDVIIQMKTGAKIKCRATEEAKDHFELIKIYIENIYFYKGFEIKENDVVLDLNAFNGAFAIFAANKAAKGQIFAFEGNKDEYIYLRENVRINELKNVKYGNYIIAKQRDESKEIITIEDVFIEQKIENVDLLKIDVKEEEYELLLNLSKGYLSRINKMVIRWHKRDATSILNLEKYLANNGFLIDLNENLLFARKEGI